MIIRRNILALLASCALATPAVSRESAGPQVLLRLDDAGMNQSVNRAIEQAAATGMPMSVSVLFVAPRWREAVEILKRHPHVDVGVHLALNAEWREYRWGPVTGDAAPSLRDSTGNFHSSRDAFLASGYDLGEVEREIDAQIRRALDSGLRVTYVDAHMAMLEATPPLRAILERVAQQHGLVVARRFGESYFTLWNVPVAAKKSAVLAHLAAPKRDTVNLVVVHPAERSEEMDRLFDMNAAAQNAVGATVGDHRAAELDAVLSTELRQLVKSGRIELISYRDLSARARRRP
jgi:predicted glycoside hydrolase/deacetylase ChbG (UPF0249 family)